MKKIKKPISVLLAALMIVSLFAAIPMTVNAAPPGGGGGGGTGIDIDPITVTKGSEFATAPTAISGLVANGTEQALINEGTTSAGTAYYYVTTEDITGDQANSLFNNPSKPGSFSTSIPKRTDAGTYYVWYAIDGGSNYEDLLPYMEINNQYESHKLTVTIAAPEYYIIGIGGDWDTLKDEYKLTKNPNNDAEYMFKGLTVGANTELKVKGTNTYYYPDGTGNNFTLVDAGTYDIYFRPDGQGGEGWWYGDIYATPSTPTYTVTWKNEDGTTLETDTDVEEGTTPTYDGTTPTKAEDENYTYTFAGWSPAIAPVTEDVTYTATFTAVPKGINYGEGYINPKGTQAVIDENNFGLNMNSYLNMQILGIQLKNSIATEGGADGVRFVTAVNSNLLKGDNIEDYGYIVAKINSEVGTLYENMDKFTADKFSEDENKFSCKGTSNSISGDFGQYSTETDYKYVTLAVTGTSEQSGNLIARFYVKTKDGKYHYADYINGNSETNSGMAFNLSAVEANLH